MGILSSFRSRIFKKKPSKYESEDGRPKTVIATGGKKGITGVSSGDRTEKALKQYWTFYSGEGTIFASINTTAWNSIMVGYSLVSDNPSAKEAVTQFFDQIDLDTVLLDNVVYALVFGDAFIEKVKGSKSKQLAELKTVDPISMVVNVDEFGRESDYQQKVGGKVSETKLTKEDILHLRLFPKPNSPYGISLIQPSIDTINRKVTTDESISNAILRHGTSKYVITVGTPDEVPPDDVFTNIKNKLEDIGSTNEIIVPGPIKVETIDEKGIAGVEEYFNYFQTQLVIGLLCPEEALGLGRGSTEATSKVKEIMYERMIKAIQHKIAKQINKELIRPFLEERGFDPLAVSLRFNSVTDADEAVKSKWLGNLLRGYPEGKKPFTLNEIRAMFDYPPIKDEGELEDEPSEEPSEEKPEEEPEPKKENKKIKNRINTLEQDLEDVKYYLDEMRNRI